MHSAECSFSDKYGGSCWNLELLPSASRGISTVLFSSFPHLPATERHPSAHAPAVRLVAREGKSLGKGRDLDLLVSSGCLPTAQAVEAVSALRLTC